MVVDPFFIMWNPYNTQITADKFAVTLEGGFAGGMRFSILMQLAYTQVMAAQLVGSRWAQILRSPILLKNKSGVNGNVLISLINSYHGAGEVMIYSPPNEGSRSANANVLNDELLPGLNYNNTDSGIFFNEFPYVIRISEWQSSQDGRLSCRQLKADAHKIDVLFNIASQSCARHC